MYRSPVINLTVTKQEKRHVSTSERVSINFVSIGEALILLPMGVSKTF